MFRGYLGEPERYARCFADGFYLTGDLARTDADGYFWFVGRADDVIKSSGHLIGPFEVESALMEHPAVAEAAVIGKPDPVAHELVKAFVSLKPGFEACPALERELLGFARVRLGAVVAPKELAFLPVLPRTRSGKITRRLLRARDTDNDLSCSPRRGHFDIAISDNPQAFQRQIWMNRFDFRKLSRDQLCIPARCHDSWFASREILATDAGVAPTTGRSLHRADTPPRDLPGGRRPRTRSRYPCDTRHSRD
jgi:hypothetical protein